MHIWYCVAIECAVLALSSNCGFHNEHTHMTIQVHMNNVIDILYNVEQQIHTYIECA